MKQNRRIFSLPLFWEGVRQTRLVGLIFAVLLALQVILIYALPTISILNDDTYVRGSFPQKEIVAGLYSAPFLLASFCVVAPLLTFTLFRFLNQRSTSDFYHAIPYTRLCVYLSFMGSLVFWFLIFALESVLLTLLMVTVCSEFFALLTGSFLLYVLALTVASVAVCAGISIGMSLTGTVFSNFVVTAMILFLPRILTLFYEYAVADSLPILSTSDFRALNLVAAPITSLLFDMLFSGGVPEYENILTNGGSILYTAALALLYLVVGALCFQHRKSETAHNSASSPKAHALIRLLLTFAYFAVCISAVFTAFVRREITEIGIFLLILFGIITYCLYELITTKSFLKLWKALPGLGYVALFVVLFYGSLTLSSRLALNFTPDAEEVESITVLSDTNRGATYLDFKQYVDLCSPEVRLTDKKIISILSDNLKKEAEVLKDGGYAAWRQVYYFGGSYIADGKFEVDTVYSAHGYTDVTFDAIRVRIQSSDGTRVRRIMISEQDRAELYAAIERDEAYRNLWMTLPEDLSNLQVFGGFLPYRASSDEQVRAILDSAREELKNADFDAWYAYCQNPKYDSFQLEYAVSDGPAQGKTLQVHLPKDLFPKTVQACLELEYKLLNQRALALENALDEYDALSEEEQKSILIQTQISLVNPETSTVSHLESVDSAAVRYLLKHVRKLARDSVVEAYSTAYVSVNPTKEWEATDVVSEEFWEKFGYHETLLLDDSFSAEEFAKEFMEITVQ